MEEEIDLYYEFKSKLLTLPGGCHNLQRLFCPLYQKYYNPGLVIKIVTILLLTAETDSSPVRQNMKHM
jgi:hypothetical protein